MKSLGENIAVRRAELGMTQEQLAEKMNVTAQAVSKWERDLSYPDVDTISKLATLFGCSIDALVSDASPVLQKDNPESIERRIVHIFVKTEDSNVHVRVPVACFIEMVKEGGIIGNIDDLPGISTVTEMIKVGVTGEIVNVEQNGKTVVISVENYES